MKRVALVTCGSKKKPGNHPAKDLYVGPYFRACMEYAESLKPDQIFILSAKHHLLRPSAKVDWYDETLNGMGVKDRREWAANVLGQIGKRFGNTKVEYTILAGARYWEFLVEELENVCLPLKGKPIGKQLQFLGRNTQ
jgi:hypothetical protein